MRTVRWLATVLALTVTLPSVGTAQMVGGSGRLFKDSWFWGAKAGTMSFSTNTTKNAIAPMLGADWVITRTRGALYVAFEQYLFNETAGLTDFQGAPFTINIRDMRRFSVAALAFPKTFGTLRPYAGVGLSLNLIQSARAAEPFDNASQEFQIRDQIEELKDRAAASLLGGLQGQFRRWTVFGQATVMPAQSRFFFSERATFIFEGGIRYNVGSSIERPQ